VALLQLEADTRALQGERVSLVRTLRGEAPPASASTSGFTPAPDSTSASASAFAFAFAVPTPLPAAAPAATRSEWTPRKVQNALLGLGGLLLAVAALVFAAVTYERLGAGGRAVVLALLTLAAGLAVPVVRRRGLLSTAETLAGVTLLLGALDAYGLRTLGLGEDLSGTSYTAASAAALAVLCTGAAWSVPVRTARTAAVLLAQLPVPLLLVEAQVSGAAAGLALTALAAADLAALAVLRGRVPFDVSAVIAGCAGVVTGLAVTASTVAAFDGQPTAGALGLLAIAALVAASAALLSEGPLRRLLLGMPVPVVALAVTALARPQVTPEQLPLVPAVVALAAVGTVCLASRGLRQGPAVGAAFVGLIALAAVALPALTGLLAPFTWLADPWSAPAGASARAALSPFASWQGTLAVPTALAVAAGTCALAGTALAQRRWSVPGAAGLAGAAVVLLPVGLDLDLRAGMALLVAVGAAAVLVPLPAAGPTSAARAGGTLALLLAGAWSLADQSSTLVVLPLVALAVARLSAGLAGALLAAAVAALGAAAGLSADQVGALLVPAAGALLAAALPRLGVPQRTGVEWAAAGTAVAAVALAAVDPGWLSWSLAGLGLAALAGALRRDRRLFAPAGALLLSASSWVRLAQAGVEHPEPYVLPLALVALLLGHLRRRTVPETGSFAAYGAGLSALLLPSLFAAYAGDVLWRPLALAGVALVVVLLGVRGRLQAPLLLGGAVLAADALRLLGPYAAALPRWLVLAVAGALLLGVGATYEQRLRELTGLRSRYAALG